MKHITCIEDLRQRHMRNVPKAFFDYVDHGSYAEQTLRANREDLEAIKLRQRILVDISKRDLSTTILGEKVPLPLILAPVGSTGMQFGDGEIHACRAAQAAGIPYTLSTMSINSIEDVAENVEKPFWFQLYVMKDRGFIKELIERAVAAKCSALVLTVDLQVLGQRHADIKNGLSVPPKLFNLKNIIDFASKPAWLMGTLRAKRRNFGNIAGFIKGGPNDLGSVSQWVQSQFDESLNWKDIEWIRSIWPGKLIVKGIHDVFDAREVAEDGRERIGGVQPRRPPARRRAVVDFGAAEGGRRRRLGYRSDVRRRHPLRTGRDAGARARRQILHDRPRVYLRPRRVRAARRCQGDRSHRAGVERDHGPVRRQQDR